MSEVEDRIAECERVLKHTERTAQHYWAAWRVLREQTNDLIEEIEELKKEAGYEP